MDYDSELAQIQGALMKADNTFPFKYITSRGGNEERIDSIVGGLLQLLTEKKYFINEKINEAHYSALRKLNFFLILNADIKFLDKLVDSDDIGHLVWVTPTIPKCLLINLIWGLNLTPLYCEAIRCCCPSLSVELLDIVMQNLKYTAPEESIRQVHLLVASSYETVLRMVGSSVKANDYNLITSSLFDKVTELLKYYMDAPNKSKMANWDESQLYVHAGNALFQLFSLLLDCFTLFLNNSPKEKSPVLEIYSTTFQNDESDGNNTNNSDETIQNCLLKLNDLLLETAKANIMGVNIDIYCSWSEHIVDEESGRTLQKSVGELAYTLCECLKSDQRFEHPIISMLPGISCKPLELFDIISDADRDTLLKNASQKMENQKEWLAALIRYEHFFSDEDCIQCATVNSHMLSTSEKKDVFNNCILRLNEKIKDEHELKLKHLALAALNDLEIKEQVSIIMSCFSVVELHTQLELPDHDIKITEFLNKLVGVTDSQLSEIYSIFIQNPANFYKRIFDESIKNVQQTDVMLLVLEKISVFYTIQYKCNFDVTKYKNTSLSNILLLVLETLNEINTDLVINTEIETQAFLHFLKALSDRFLLDYEIVVLKYLMPSIHTNLTKKNFRDLLLKLQALAKIFCLKKSPMYISPLLVMLAQVIETSRWAFDTFTQTRMEIVEMTIQFVSQALQTFLRTKTAEDNEYKWLCAKLIFLTPINLQYYHDLWPKITTKMSWDPTLDESQTNTFLCYFLPRAISDEWKELFAMMQNARGAIPTYEKFCFSVNVFSSLVDITSKNSLACLEYCCRNTALILEDLIPSINSSADTFSIIKNTIQLLNNLPEKLRYGCFLSIMGPLYAIMRDIPQAEYQNITNAINELKCSESKKYLSDMLINE